MPKGSDLPAEKIIRYKKDAKNRSYAGPFHRNPAPTLGQHNHELLAELGLTTTEIAELEADGIIGNTLAVRTVR